jgi:hypothetical protein
MKGRAVRLLKWSVENVSVKLYDYHLKALREVFRLRRRCATPPFKMTGSRRRCATLAFKMTGFDLQNTYPSVISSGEE